MRGVAKTKYTIPWVVEGLWEVSIATFLSMQAYPSCYLATVIVRGFIINGQRLFARKEKQQKKNIGLVSSKY